MDILKRRALMLSTVAEGAKICEAVFAWIPSFWFVSCNHTVLDSNCIISLEVKPKICLIALKFAVFTHGQKRNHMQGFGARLIAFYNAKNHIFAQNL